MLWYLRVLLLAAVLPVIVLVALAYRQDKLDRESPRMLWRLFFGGLLCALPACALELLYQLAFGSAQTVAGAFFQMFLGVGLVEEGCKLFTLRRRSWRDPEFNCRFDGVLYAIFVSLGFACIENILYVFQYGVGVAVTRALLSIPGHAVFGVFMGAFYSDAKLLQTNGLNFRPKLAMALFVPMAMHGLYDFLLTLGSGGATVIFFIYAVALDVFAVILVRRRARDDRFL